MEVNPSAKVEHYVSELTGDRSDDAWHSLVEMGPAVLAHVIHAFEGARDQSVAVRLIGVVNEYRTEAALPFLANLLRADEPPIWKSALDSIVAIGGSKSAECLREIYQALSAEKQAWLEEAVEQISAGDG